jgi:hypothetical protein
MKAFRILLVILFVLPLPFSSCDKIGPQNRYIYSYEIISIRNEVGLISNEQNYITLEPTSRSIAFDSLRKLGIAIRSDSVMAADQSLASARGFYASVIADPAPPVFNTNIALISIYPSDSIYTESYSFGPDDSIISLFQASRFYDYETQDVLTFISNLDSWYVDEELLFHFNTKVRQSYTGTFSIKLTMDNGDELCTETELLTIE